ncbi:hypothetical protein [Chryseobacterium arthrosphaerae]|uniref:Uncharacterized protein n=1 Tax=Chryseobacterium arthrosphaerae TaxID=651561 RepID=A0A1B8ZV45_9FLAO|nr:hypothetical protein [Chryseobacterium arthrosphaerae]OCA75434.1 hypothetical protein BBI00_14360 [Chryseobacterium arthrosphaerae]
MISYISQKNGINNFCICEDSLTASIFDLIKYLPSEYITDIIKNSLLHDKIPTDCGILLSLSFWDKWNPRNTINEKYVEPDIFLRFENIDIIIEAKRFDYFQQFDDQIKKEITAYFNEYGFENKDLYFIQLGGIYNHDDDNDLTDEFYTNKSVKVCKTTWTNLLNTIVNFKEYILSKNNQNEQNIIRILDDIIKAFEIHQFYKINWLNNLKEILIDQASFNHLSYCEPKITNWLSGLSNYKINTNKIILFPYA